MKDCVNISKLKDLDVSEAAFITGNDEFSDAKIEELASWMRNDVYSVAEDVGQPFLNVRWVLTEKDGKRKARLVVKGFEDPELSSLIKDSPTCSKETFRTMISVATSRGWNSNCMDIRTAFL